jgi:TolB-like protein
MRRKMFLLWGIVMVMVLFLSLAFSYENEVRSAAGTLAQFVRESGKKTVAVVDFTDLQGNVMELGRFLAEELSIALSSLAQKDFRVMDRTHLRALLKEHQLSLSGLIDPSTARKVGELSGVDALVTGTLTPFGDNVRLALKVIELSTAEILGSTSVNIGRTQAINELLSREVAQEAPALVVQETTVAAATPTPTPKPTPSPTPSPEAIVVETEELVFRVIACGFSEGEFWCRLTVTSKKQDRNLWIYALKYNMGLVTRVIDERGEEYKLHPKKFCLGGNWGRESGLAIVYDYVAWNLLPRDVPVQAWLHFPNVPREVQRIALLEIVYSFDKETIYRVQFRNIPVKGE